MKRLILEHLVKENKGLAGVENTTPESKSYDFPTGERDGNI